MLVRSFRIPLGVHLYPLARAVGSIVLGLAALLGVLFVILGFLPDARLATIDLAVMGVANGIWSIVGIAWVQKVVASDMRGREMSVVMLASAGVMPFSYALAGWLADITLTLMFIVAGAIIINRGPILPHIVGPTVLAIMGVILLIV